MKHAFLAPVVFALAACGGGGNAAGAGGTTPTGIPAVTPTPAAGILVAGSVVQIPADAYGPTTMGATTYASADASQTAPLVNATVILGPLPVTGATPPAQLPPGDVAATTDAGGTFAVTLAVAAAAPASVEPFVIPQNNILGFTPPATGYYIEVFGLGTDGTNAGVPLPLHRFVAATSVTNLRVSTASAAEASALRSVNGDRAANNAGPLIFDESAEEVARLHAADESLADYTCHYDMHGIGPSSRYLAGGGIGLTGEGIALVAGTPAVAFSTTESAFLAEKTATPPGGHYRNLIDPAHRWAGLAAVPDRSAPSFANVDYELVTPSALDAVVGAYGYPVSAPCPSGTVANNS